MLAATPLSVEQGEEEVLKEAGGDFEVVGLAVRMIEAAAVIAVAATPMTSRNGSWPNAS